MAQRNEHLRRAGGVDVRALTPTVRDFTQRVATQKQALAVIAELARATPEEGPLQALDVEALCRAADATDVSALAVATDPVQCQGDLLLLAQASRAFEGPLLMRDLVVSRDQLYAGRLHGADAVLLTAGALSVGELKACIDISASMHVAAPVEVRTAAELDASLAAGARIIVIPAFKAAALDLALADALLPRLPRTAVAVVRGPFASPDDLRNVRGRADAVWIAGPWLTAKEPETFLRPFVEAAENG
jgi:indole-3-glycerol phosphate synthase